jgi:4'-phosphopantetheinyl transferase
VCAVYDSAIGVDIEKIRPVNVNVINKVCNKQELEYIYSGKEKMSERFFEIWTFKEACFKRIGTGITDFESISYFDSYNNKKMFALDDYVLYVVY